MKKTIGIIGFGNMGSAIGGRLKARYQVFVFDKDKNKTQNLAGIKLAKNIKDLVTRVDVVILAVKPQDFDSVLSEIKDYAQDKLIISIAAGITTAYIQKLLGDVRAVRVMPNMPVRIGKGMSCLCKGKFATRDDLGFVRQLFDNLGETLVIDEGMMDAATAISGSGPGFWCEFIENKPEDEWESYSQNELIPLFTSAAESIGFSKKKAGLLAKATVMGSLVTVQSSGEKPLKFKWSIASKGGTTEAALEVLHRGGTLVEAVKAALRRAKELSRR